MQQSETQTSESPMMCYAYASVRRCFVLLSLWLAAGQVGASDPRPLLLAIDAEFGVRASTSAQAIQRGAEIAADEVNAAGGLLGGRLLRIVVRNNNSVPARAAENVRELAGNPDVIAVMGGKHSPVIQHLVPLIHELKIPYLIPWAAADDLTRHQHEPSYIFRLSMTDTWAMQAMVRAAGDRGLQQIGVLLPRSGWGRSSLAALEAILQGQPHMQLAAVQWYNFGDQYLSAQYEALRKAGAKVLVLVANEQEGATLVRHVGHLPASARLPILSHWGITGGEFFSLTAGALAEVDLSVVQTYAFVGQRGSRARRIIEALVRKHGVSGERQIDSPVGVAHAYDLTLLLADAVQRANSADRSVIRSALEDSGDRVGLLKRYRPAFSAQRHEALDASLVFMARYAPDGAIVPLK